MTMEPDPYPGIRCPAEVIGHAVWLHHCFSLHGVETIPAAYGVVVSYGSIRDRSLRFARLFADTLKRGQPKPGDK